MNDKLTVKIKKGENGYYIASVPELPGCHTQAKTLNELMERIKEAVELYLEVIQKDLRGARRDLIDFEFVGVSPDEAQAIISNKTH